MRRIAIFLVILLCAGQTMALYAAEPGREYTAFDKFSRSIFNVFTSYLEIPFTVFKVSVEKNPLEGVLYGLPLGVGKSIIRFGTGLVELTMFPYPPYEPLYEPEYFFSK